MSMYVRQLTIDELTEIQKLKASKTKPARQVQRAKIIWFSHQKTKVPQIATKVALCSASVRKWIRRFNQLGLSGLLDAPRTGRPKYYTQETHGKVIALARTKPESLGYPFTCWTIRRLSTALWETERLNLAISVIWRWIKKEGLVWKKQQTWFNVPRDEEFVEKRGPLFMPTPPPYQKDESSA